MQHMAAAHQVDARQRVGGARTWAQAGSRGGAARVGVAAVQGRRAVGAALLAELLLQGRVAGHRAWGQVCLENCKLQMTKWVHDDQSIRKAV